MTQAIDQTSGVAPRSIVNRKLRSSKSATASAPSIARAIDVRQSADAALDAPASALFLIALSAAAGTLGNLAPALECGLLILALSALLFRCRVSGEGWLAAALGVAVCVAVVPPGSCRWAGMFYVVIGLALAAVRIRRHRPGASTDDRPTLAPRHLTTFAAITAAVMMFDLAVLATPQIRSGLDPALRSASESLMGIWHATTLPAATTYWALPTLLAFILLALLSRPRSRAVAMLGLGAGSVVLYFKLIALLQALSFGVPWSRAFQAWYERPSGPYQQMAEPVTWRFAVQWLAIERPQLLIVTLLGASCFLASLISSGRRRAVTIPAAIQDSSRSNGGSRFENFRWRAIAATVGFAVAGAVLARLTAPVAVAQSSLAGVRAAVLTSNIDMRVPEHGQYGDRAIGMFGCLPGSLRSLGLSVDSIGSISKLRPEHQILVMANLQETFSPEDKAKIQQWVRDGGGLFVLTDHTGDDGLRIPTNDLLEPFGMSVNFDSARVFNADGREPFEPLVGSPLSAIRGAASRNAETWGTGGSVTLRGGAVPFVQLRYAYSDPGSFTAVDRGMCGNLEYDIGEPLGDIPVAGFAKAGKGRVLLFGDTSPLQNGAFAISHEFVRQSLGTLLPGGPEPTLGRAWSVAAALVAVGLIALLLSGRATTRLLIPLGIGTAVWAGGWALLRQLPEPVQLTGTRTAFIDLSLMPYVGQQGWTATDLGGLEACLQREGMTPVETETDLPSQLARGRSGDVLFLIAPLRTPSARETDAVDRFLRTGGTVIVNAGAEEGVATNRLLERFGARVTELPLGATPDELAKNPDHVHVFNAWEVSGPGEVMLRQFDKPVIIETSVGAGRLVLIGDSKFFWDANLENRQSHRPGNIDFLGRLVNGPGYVPRREKPMAIPATAPTSRPTQTAATK